KVELAVKSGDGFPGAYRCVCLLGTRPRAPLRLPQLVQAVPGAQEPVKRAADLYNGVVLFHGPAFRTIQRVLRLDGESIVAECRRVDIPARDQGQFPRGGLVDGFVADTTFQLALVWARETRGAGSLPNFAKAIDFYREVPERWRCVMRRDDAGETL